MSGSMATNMSANVVIAANRYSASLIANGARAAPEAPCIARAVSLGFYRSACILRAKTSARHRQDIWAGEIQQRAPSGPFSATGIQSPVFSRRSSDARKSELGMAGSPGSPDLGPPVPWPCPLALSLPRRRDWQYHCGWHCPLPLPLPLALPLALPCCLILVRESRLFRAPRGYAPVPVSWTNTSSRSASRVVTSSMVRP